MSHGVVIIGNGVAGITTARTLRKHSNVRIRVISGESPYFFSRTALMYVYMGHMTFDHIKPYEDWFWEKNKIELIQAWVERVKFAEKKIHLSTGEEIAYDRLVLATGSTTRYFNWPGQELDGVQGLVSLQDLTMLEARTAKNESGECPVKQAYIIGGGLIGVELAEMLHSRGIAVTMVIREDFFWDNVLTQEEAAMVTSHIQSRGIHVLQCTEIAAILGDADQKVRAIKLKSGEELPCQLVGITTGVQPNVEFLKSSALHIDRGIVVNEYLETAVADVYAAGDCAQVAQPRAGRLPVEAVWYVGRMMGEALGQTLAGQRTAYVPGPWFNSAKFVDLEYQTYGKVRSSPDETQAHFSWRHPERYQLITLAFHPDTRLFQGINTFGIRMKHSFFDRVLKEKWRVDRVVEHLKEAHFDPEFYGKNYRAILHQFKHSAGQKKHGKHLGNIA